MSADDLDPSSYTPLPHGVVVAWDVGQIEEDHDFRGNRIKTVAISFAFKVTEQDRALQTFIIHADDAADIRRALKNPRTITPQEETQ